MAYGGVYFELFSCPVAEMQMKAVMALTAMWGGGQNTQHSTRDPTCS